MIRERARQQAAFATPEVFSQPVSYQGADTLDILARDICGQDTWFSTLMPDTERFFYAMQGGDPADFNRVTQLSPGWFTSNGNMIQMEYCKVHSTHLADCSDLFTSITNRMSDKDITAQAMQDAESKLGVQGCGLLRMTMTLAKPEKTMVSHHVVAGLINDRWRVLLFMPSSM